MKGQPDFMEKGKKNVSKWLLKFFLLLSVNFCDLYGVCKCNLLNA